MVSPKQTAAIFPRVALTLLPSHYGLTDHSDRAYVVVNILRSCIAQYDMFNIYSNGPVELQAMDKIIKGVIIFG